MISKIKQLKNHQGFMKYFKNTSWLFAEKILRMVVGLFIGVWVARYLGPEKFGILSYAQSFVGLFSAIAMMGLNSLVVKEIVEEKYALNEIMGTSFFLKIIGSIFVFIFLFISIQFTNNSHEENKYIFIIALSLIIQSFNIIEFYFQSQVISKYIVYANLLSLIISSILKILFIIKNIDLIYFAWMIVFDTFTLIIGFIYFYYKNSELKIIEWRINKDLVVKFLTQGYPLILSGMSFVIYNNIDKIMLQNMLNSYSVGIYSSATKLVLIWHFLPGLIVTSLMPLMVQNYNSNIKKFLIRLQYIASFLIWTSVVIIIIYIVFSEYIINITYGEKFIEAHQIMSILVLSNLFIFFNTVWNRWQLLKENTKITFYFSLFTSILNIVFNYIFIKQFGVIGATYGMILSLFISSFIFYVILDNQVVKLFFRALFFIKDKSIEKN